MDAEHRIASPPRTDRIPGRTRGAWPAGLPVIGGSVMLLVAALLPAPVIAQTSVRPPASRPPSSGSSAAPQVPAPAAADRPAPESIPVPEIARRADEAGRALRDLESQLRPDAFAESIERRLPDIAARIAAQLAETDRQLLGEPPTAILDGLAAQWEVTRAEMGGYVNVLAQRATALEAAMKRLTALQDTWTQARTDARAARAPAPVLQRIDGILAALATARERVQGESAAALILQDRFAQEVSRSEGALARIARARQDTAGLFERNTVPLWHPGELAATLDGLRLRVARAIDADIALLRQFARDNRWKLPFHAALLLALVVAMRAVRRHARPRSEPEPASAQALDRPLSAAMLPTLLAIPWIYPAPLPRAAVAVAQLLALGPALRVMRLLVDRSLVPGLYVLGAFFLVDVVRHLAAVEPVLERQVFLVESLAGVVVLGWWLASKPPRSGWWRIAGGVALVAFAAAFAAGVSGYMRLALLLGGQILWNAYLALMLYAGVRVGDGLVASALRARPLCYLGAVQRQRPLLEQRAHGLLRGLAATAWVILALRSLGLWSAALALAASALAATLHLGSFGVSLGDAVAFALTVVAAVAVSRLVRFVLAEDIYPRLNLARGLPHALSSLVHYVLLTAGFLLALSVLGVDLTKVTILAGALGVGIGFGLQNVVNNFVSGTIILFERRINVGDAVQIGTVSGQVQHMGLRACTVRTWDGAEVIVPNASLTADNVTNWTLSDRLRRIDVSVPVPHGTNPGAVQDVMLAVARAHKLVLDEPPPAALLLDLGPSALRFELRAWTAQFELWMQIQSELSTELCAALGRAGIPIAVPQREVRLK